MTELSPVRRPAVRWFGGKWKMAPRIIEHFPAHRVYVEPFGGGGSILLRKPRTYAEVYNDLDVSIVGLFRVLRDPERAARLTRLLELTPFAREEFHQSYEASDDPVEAARRLLVMSFMGFGSNAHAKRSTGFRSNSNRSGTTPAQDWANYPGTLALTVERLRGVVIDNRDALEVMAQHDGPETLHYLDPPYVWETRSRSDVQRHYRHEMTDADHARLLDFIKDLKGRVVLSGYAHPLYDRALSEWRRIEFKAHADGARPRTEVLWLNFDEPRQSALALEGAAA